MASTYDPDGGHQHIQDLDVEDTLNTLSHNLNTGASVQKTIRPRDSTKDVHSGVEGAAVQVPANDLDGEVSSEKTIVTRVHDHSKNVNGENTDVFVTLSPGQGLMVKLNNSNVEFKINYDALGYRFFTSGTENPAPMIIQRPSSYNVFLFKRHYGNTFNFFSLPGEIRNLIYGFLFQEAPEPNKDSRFHFFKYRKAQNPVRFFTHLNKKATGRSGLPFANRQTLHETMPFFLGSRYFEFDNDNALRIFLKSIGPHGRSIWSGPLRILSYRDEIARSKWQGNSRYKSNESWTGLLAECHNLRAIRIRVDDENSLRKGSPLPTINYEPFHLLIAHGHGQFPRLDSVTMDYVSQRMLIQIMYFHRITQYERAERGQQLSADLLALFKSSIEGEELAKQLCELPRRTNEWLKIPRS